RREAQQSGEAPRACRTGQSWARLNQERPGTAMHDAPPPHGLDGVEIFEELGPAERARLARELTLVSLRRGETPLRQHEAADALYVIVTGRFAITIDGRPGPIAELGPEQPVGEIAFLAGGARTATVTALRDGVALRLGRTQFEELSAKSPAIWRALTLALARRVAKANIREPTPPDPPPRTVTLIRARDSALPAAFVTQLLAAFQRSSATLLLDAQRAQSVLPSGTRLDGAAATQALNALETKAAHLLYVADDELTAWSEKAIRQADLVLAVGYHSAATQPNALERRAAELLLPEAQRLVLLHATRGPISGTAAWLASRRIAMHHHVALDRPGDIERLYR